MNLPRARRLGDTYRLAVVAGARAGVTRLADVGGLGGLGLPVFQAIRPRARSLTVSQGKGVSPLAAKVSALLEACELACAENLPEPADKLPLAALSPAARHCWSGNRPALTFDLDPALPRGWVVGRVLGTDAAMPMPWDILSLDFTREPLEYLANSDGLATGNTRDEAVVAALCELVEHHFLTEFHALAPIARRARQIDASSIPRGRLANELQTVVGRGFTPRLWSLGPADGIPVIACRLLAPDPPLDAMIPTGGSGCHPDPETAGLAALREAVQGRAALVAGARDDIVPDHFREGRERARALAFAALAVAEGELAWTRVPAPECRTVTDALALLRSSIALLTDLPVVVFVYPAPVEGLHVVHALAPGLRNRSRRKVDPPADLPTQACHIRTRARSGRAVLFAGPSLAGASLPREVEHHPPAVCGDLAALLATPPAAVGLIDGHFGIAPTVWHKEILDLLACGVRVLGAASIGALRAAELADAGMEGVGAIYAAYRAGTIERDDAVMVLQAPADYGFAPLTVPLVDAEHALHAVECPEGERRMMQRIVRTTAYQVRTWPHCLDAYRRRMGAEFPVALEALARVPSLKRQDAQLLVERLLDAARAPMHRVACPPPPMTNHYLRMLARRSQEGAPVRS